MEQLRGVKFVGSVWWCLQPGPTFARGGLAGIEDFRMQGKWPSC
jgi:hypothetical protein